MSAARLLYVGGHLPYCPSGAPYAFRADQTAFVAPDGSGSLYQLRLTPEQYAYAFWRVKSWKVSADIEIEDQTTVGTETITWSLSCAFEDILEREVNEGELVCQPNRSEGSQRMPLGSPFAVVSTYLDEPQIFEGQLETVIDGDSVVEEAEFRIRTLMGLYFLQTSEEGGEYEVNAAGLSSDENGNFSVLFPLILDVVAQTESENTFTALATTFSRDVDEETLEPSNSEESGEIEIKGLGQNNLAVPIYIEKPSVTVTNLSLEPHEYYEYALNSQLALYDSETGEVIGEF
jgi:hypothetical protein